MAHKLGAKGQIVIEKAIRDKLGVKPGWVAVQLLVDDHVQIHFVPPEHNESIAGILGKYAKPELASEEAFQAACDAAWLESAEERWLHKNAEHE